MSQQTNDGSAGPHDPASAAYAAGISAGRRKDTREENPYPEGSEEAKAFDRGYLDGQRLGGEDDAPSH